MIIIKDYRKDPKNARLGFVDIEMPKIKMFFTDLNVCEKNGNRWVDWGSCPPLEENGEWRKRAGFTEKGLKTSFSEAVLNELSNFTDDL